MAEDQDTQEKTEEPTSRKIEKSIEDGQMLTSKEMFVCTSIFMALLVLMFISTYVPHFLSIWKKMFIFTQYSLDFQILLEGIMKLLKSVILVILMIGIPMLITSIITQFCVGGGIYFVPKSISFKGNKLNPISGLKRIFSMQGFMELVKSVLKVSLLGGVSFFVIYGEITRLMQLSERNLVEALKSFFILYPKLTIALLIVLVIIGIIDFLWQKHTHMEKLKMSIKELKDEMKETDGSPEVKQKIRKLQNEISQRASKQSAALEDVKDASVVITNPTHFAVALKYAVGSEGAPVILALGRGLMAEKIIELAKDSNVTVFRSALLARALYFTGEIGAEISEKLYSSVAAILAYVFKVNKGEESLEPTINLPDEMLYDEYGNLLNKSNENET